MMERITADLDSYQVTTEDYEEVKIVLSTYHIQVQGEKGISVKKTEITENPSLMNE